MVIEGWQVTKWGCLARLEYGKSLRDYDRDPSSEKPYRVFGTNGPIGWHSSPLCAQEGIVVGRKGAYRGIHFSQNPFFVIDTAFYLKPTTQFDIRWAYYQLKDFDINKLDSGSAIPSTSRDAFYDIPVALPPLAVQQRIASILSAYDELIENSQRRIKILESMARALYREWFVHFHFPGHEIVPRVASALGEIPQGWEVTTLGELYNTGSGGTPSRGRPEYFENGTIDWVKSQELLDGFVLSTGERITEWALKESSAKLFPANAVLIALYGATIGKLAILSRPAATNQACCAVLPKYSAFGREFAFLTLLMNRERIIGLRLGAAQQNISQVLLRNLECVKPPDELVRRFSDQSAPFFDQILALQRKIQNLRRTRDLLLPRLLSGQIDVSAQLMPDAVGMLA